MGRLNRVAWVVALCVLVGGIATAGPIANVVGLQMDEGQGSWAYDSSGALNDAQLYNSASWTSGKVGGGVHFDGVNGHMQIAHSDRLNPTSGLTAEGWFYVDQDPNTSSANNWRWLFSKGGTASPFDCVFEQTRQLCFSVTVDGARRRWWTGKYLPLNEWAHAAWTYDGATGMMNVYVNGQGVSHSIGTTGDLATNASDLFLSSPSGTPTPSGAGTFPGKIDEFALYDRVLSATEVAERYNHGGGMPVEPHAPVAVYHLDEQRSDHIVDASGNQNHGTLGYDATHTPDGKFDNGAIFDGVGDHATIPDSPSFDSITEGITIEGWAKLTSDPEVDPATNNYRMIVSKGGTSGAWDIVLEQSRQTQWSVRIDDGSGVVTRQRWKAGPLWPVDDWVHFAYSYDGATGRMVTYFNGTPYDTTKPTGTIVADNYPVYLSYPNNSAIPTSSGAFPGIFDEVAIYSRALSDSDILARYSDGPPEPALVLPLADKACFHLNEPGGTTAYNALGSNHGTLAGGCTRGDGMFHNAVHFDGIDGHMSAPMPAAVSPTTGLTVEGWFYVDQNPNVDGNNNWRWIFNKGGWATPFDCILEQGRNLCYSIKLDGDATPYRWNSGKYLPLNEWAHAAWTYDAASGMMNVYINGEGVSHYIGTTGNLATNDLPFYLSWNSGTAFPIGSGAFPGWMDEVAVYGHALTSTEILARFADGPPRTPEPATFAILGAGALALARRRRRK